MTDAEKCKLLRNQNEDLKERLVGLLDIKTRFDGLWNMFTLLKDGFGFVKHHYIHRLREQFPDLPDWETMVKQAGAAQKTGPLGDGQKMNLHQGN